MNPSALVLPILAPLIAGILVLALPKKWPRILALAAAIFNFSIACVLFRKEMIYSLPWAGFGADLILRLYPFSAFIVLAASFFGLAVVIYSFTFFKGAAKQFYAYLLISLSFVNGAVLADNMIILLFFWEGLLLTLFGLIATGGKQAFKTATKSFVIVGVCDLCLMAGIALTGSLAGTMEISKINLYLNPAASLAFILLAVGAISKAGSMPFHTWIPDAALDAPLPFMAFFPASIEKLLGIYFLTRISMDMFRLSGSAPLSAILMSIGAATIILAVMMALVQKDYKKLLSYHAVSQVGYMILGIGTCLPAGIIGGIFHMVNNALYKSCLFFTGGAVERQAGTTDLEKLGGLRRHMPVTLFCFLVTAAAISGLPPLNGFFSKELVYDAALERGRLFYLAAVAGSFFTAASFLKLGHAAFFGKARGEHKDTKEAPFSMLIPMIVIALICVFLGVFNSVPLDKVIGPILGERAAHRSFAGFPANLTLTLVTVLVLLGAAIHHLVFAKITGSGLKAADHIHYAPGLSTIYRWAEKKYFDPYEIGRKILGAAAQLLWRIDRIVDWIYNSFTVKATYAFSRAIHKAHAGYYVIYVVWSLLGAFLVMLFVFA